MVPQHSRDTVIISVVRCQFLFLVWAYALVTAVIATGYNPNLQLIKGPPLPPLLGACINGFINGASSCGNGYTQEPTGTLLTGTKVLNLGPKLKSFRKWDASVL